MTPGRIFNLICGACLAAALAWWFWPSAAQNVAAPKPVHHVAEASAEASPLPETAPPPVADSLPTAPALSAGADPQADLSTTIPELIREIQSGDMATMMQNFMPPDEFAKLSDEQKATMAQQMQQAMAQNPQMQQRMQSVLQALESIRGATPVLDATGEKATFTPMALPGNPPTMSFVKVNGRWYLSGN